MVIFTGITAVSTLGPAADLARKNRIILDYSPAAPFPSGRFRHGRGRLVIVKFGGSSLANAKRINNGKVVGVSVAETSPGLILASMQLAQTDVYYYGYWVYDPVADYYYWFTADVVIVDASWVDYVP